MPQFFIDRPIFAWVVALFILLAGILAIPNMPVSQYPDVAPPAITITATYPGASAKEVADSVTSIIEDKPTAPRACCTTNPSVIPTASPPSRPRSSRGAIPTSPRSTCRTASPT